MSATAPVIPTKTCRGYCGRELPATREFFPFDGRKTPRGQCRRCVSERKRRSEQGPDLGWREVDLAPDNRPAVRLRKELEGDRRRGLPFDAVWLAGIELVISSYGLADRDAESWRWAFAATESAWRAAYDRTVPNVSSLQVDLLAA